MNHSLLFLDNQTCPVSDYMMYPYDDMTCPIDSEPQYTDMWSMILCIGPLMYELLTFALIMFLATGYFMLLLLAILAFSFGFMTLLSALFYICLACFRAHQETIDNDFMDDAMSSLTQKHFPKDRAD